MSNEDIHCTKDDIFRKHRRPNTLKLNCKLEIPPNTEDNVVLATPAIWRENEVLQSPGLGWRHIQFFLMYFIVTGSFIHRTCLSVAVVAMTTHIRPDQEIFNWSKERQGSIVGSFLWGYAATQIPAGYLTTRFGAKRLQGLSLILSSIISLCIPLVTRQWDWVGLTVLRVCTGLVQGITFPGTFTLLGKWTVPQEKSAASAFTITAQPSGIFLAMALSGVIAVNLGWESIFYIYSSITLVFAVVWFIFAAEDPEVHPYISEKEQSFIRQTIGKSSSPPRGSIPWRSILTSMPIICAIVANVGSAWCLWFVLAALPRYMNDVFELSISLNGVASGIPFLCTAVFGQLAGFISDTIIRNGLVTTLFARKLMNTLGFFGPALMFVAVVLTPTDYKIIQIIELILAVGLLGCAYSGFMVNFVDLSPRFSGLTFAISNFVASIISATAPSVAGALVDKLGDDVGWSASFYLAAGVISITNIVYLIFASAELQPWNEDEEKLSKHKKKHDSTQAGCENPTFTSA